MFSVGKLNGWLGLEGTIIIIFITLFWLGMTNPNTSALSIAPFSRNVGVASALLGAMQLGLGAVSSSAMGLFSSKADVLLATFMVVAGVMSALILF